MPRIKYYDAETGTWKYADNPNCIAPDDAGYINQIPVSVDSDGSVYNTIGYKSGYRLSSSGTEKALAGSFVTGFIPVKAGDVIRIAACPGMGARRPTICVPMIPVSISRAQ